MWQRMYSRLLKPRSRSEDERRREFILNVLLLGTTAFALIALATVVYDIATHNRAYQGNAIAANLAISVFFVALFALSRRGFYRLATYAFLVILFVFSTYPLIVWGLQLPQGILTYSLIIVIAGILLRTKVAFGIAGFMTVTLLLIKRLEDVGAIRFDTQWMSDDAGYDDIIVYGFTFALVALVSWLSNREIERSLRRVRQSEAALRVERDSLEAKVKERTKELEKTQVEKMQELNRFAEFGRLTSTLLHELVNPLTSVSLNLEQMEHKQKSSQLQQLRKGITYIEQYVDDARRQLRDQNEITEFDAGREIRGIVSMIRPKARTLKTTIELHLDKGIKLRGNPIRFNQIMTNLIGNSVDACRDTNLKGRKITVRAQRRGKKLKITVQDNGKGIAPQDLERVFEPFYTAKGPGQRGTGLGLTITKQLVQEDFNGTITASSLRGGTRFTVTIPLP